MKIGILSLLCLISIHSFSQDPAELVRDGMRLELMLHDAEALAKFKEALKTQPTNVYALCRCSELCSRLANRVKNNNKLRNDYYSAAKTYAETALNVSPNSSDPNFVMAVVMGRLALTKSGREKISAAKDIKKYADLALLYDKTNYKAWHVLGKWFYEVSDLNGFERIGIKWFYGGMPKASFNDAINAYEKSRELAPTFMLNYLELARTYHKNHQDAKAIGLLKLVPNLPIKTEDDLNIKEQSKKMLAELQ